MHEINPAVTNHSKRARASRLPHGYRISQTPKNQELYRVDADRNSGIRCISAGIAFHEKADGSVDVAIAACNKNNSALEGICKLKSTRLWASKAQQPARAPI